MYGEEDDLDTDLNLEEEVGVGSEDNHAQEPEPDPVEPKTLEALLRENASKGLIDFSLRITDKEQMTISVGTKHGKEQPMTYMVDGNSLEQM